MKKAALALLCVLGLLGCGPAEEAQVQTDTIYLPVKHFLFPYPTGCPPYSPSGWEIATPFWGPDASGAYQELIVLQPPQTGIENEFIIAIVQQSWTNGVLGTTCYDATPSQWKVLSPDGQPPSELYSLYNSFFTYGTGSYVKLWVYRYEWDFTNPGNPQHQARPQTYTTTDGGYTWTYRNNGFF